MIPTNAIRPLTATAAAVPSVAAAMITSRARRTFSPSAEASSSPSPSTSSTRPCSRITTEPKYAKHPHAQQTPPRANRDERPREPHVVPVGGDEAAEQPGVDLAQVLRPLLQHEGLAGGEEGRHRHAGEDQRAGRADAAERAADRVRPGDGERGADERGGRDE